MRGIDPCHWHEGWYTGCCGMDGVWDLVLAPNVLGRKGDSGMYNGNCGEERPDIYLGGLGLPGANFWSQVEGRATNGFGEAEVVGHAKITELKPVPALVDDIVEDVLRLNISMANLSECQVVESAEHLSQDLLAQLIGSVFCCDE